MAHELSDSEFDDLASCCESLYDAKAKDEIAATFGDLSNCGDRYRDAEEIGVGGMKCVSNVLDSASERRLAMAVLRDDLDQSFDEALLREARLTALLDHPNVMSVHDVGLTADNRVFFTMDLKPGKSLDQILASQKDAPSADFPLDERLRIFSRVCDALAFAHSKHVIHLDVKPANVQIGSFGEVLLCDWGLAKILEKKDEEDTLDLLGSVSKRRDVLNGMTTVGRVKGTPGFMAPEQIKADGTKDEQSDVFSLGCLLYSLCTLQRPFEGSSEQIMERTLQGTPEPIPPSVPKSLAAVIERAMAVEKRNRYSSVIALQREIDEYRKGFSTLAESAGLGKEALLFVRRNRTPVGVACLSLCIIALLTAFYVGHLQATNKQLELRTQELIEARETAEDAQVVAEQQRDRAERERDEAERARLAEVEANRKVQALNLGQIHQQMNNVIYEWPVSAAQAAEKRWQEQRSVLGDTPEIMAGLQECLFIQQSYSKVIEIEPQTDAMKVLKKLAERYRTTHPGFHTPSTLRDLATELTQAGRFELATNVLLGDAARVGPEPRDYFPAVVAMLAVINPEWDPKETEYQPEQGILRLRGRQLTRLSSDPKPFRTPIRLLHVKHLDLRGTGIAELEPIRPLNLYSIDLRDTPVKKLEILKWTRNLQKIIVEKDRFPKGAVPRKMLVEK
jgi:serine/threonine-protein kinase